MIKNNTFFCGLVNSVLACSGAATGLILVPFSTIILVLVAGSQEQITAAIGALGAIAGYLFGAASSQRSKEDLQQPKKENLVRNS